MSKLILLVQLIVLGLLPSVYGKPPLPKNYVYATWDENSMFRSSKLEDDCLKKIAEERLSGEFHCESSTAMVVPSKHVFENEKQAEFYKGYCIAPDCTNWKMRPATASEVRAQMMAPSEVVVAAWSEMWTSTAVCSDNDKIEVLYSNNKTGIECLQGKYVEGMKKIAWFKDAEQTTYTLAEKHCTDFSPNLLIRSGEIYCSPETTLEYNKPHPPPAKPWFQVFLETQRANRANSALQIQ